MIFENEIRCFLFKDFSKKKRIFCFIGIIDGYLNNNDLSVKNCKAR